MKNEFIFTNFIRCIGKQFSGFTLAEVLITIAIIGIVAAMTIPTLISKYNENATVSKLKKAYAEINQVLKLSEVDHGFTTTWRFNNINDIEDSEQQIEAKTQRNVPFVQDYILKYMKTVKVCEYEPTSAEDNECWTTPKSPNGLKTVFVPSYAGSVAFITASGYSVLSFISGNGQELGFLIDIDGPNRGEGIMGKDVFYMYGSLRDSETMRSGLGFYGYFRKPELSVDDMLNDERFGCNNDITSRYAGSYCGLLIQNSGWKIPDNYPIKF